jgi:tRNA-specific 2-thiouridylase
VRVLVAMSGGVDSSVAAALLVEAGHDVVGATMKLWGGPSDSGCCSVADVEDARWVANRLGVDHHVFNFSDDFDRHVVRPYVGDHAAGLTPNPCVECNRHLKFDRFLVRAANLGFDAIATGHHARVRERTGRWILERGVDTAKDQSYVLHMLGQSQLSRLLLPVGELTKAQVRQIAAGRGFRTAEKPDSQDVCFITRTAGREAFLGDRIPLRPARVVDRDGAELGTLPALELVTIGQRRGLGALAGAAAASRGGADTRRYVVTVDQAGATVTVGTVADLLVGEMRVRQAVWTDCEPAGGEHLLVQASAHGRPVPGRWLGGGLIGLDQPVRKVAPGQSVVLYRGDAVVGGGISV